MTRPLRVFLCHASQDKPIVWKLHRYLIQHGIKPWLDREDLLPGEDWEVEIPRALFASDVILVCLSKNSVNKEGFVQKEITFALDKAMEKPEGTIFIIPVKLEECEIPKRLTRYQWVDLSRPDGRRRLLMGLNKRVNDLGDEVQQIILDDTRQKKSVFKPVDADPVNRDEIKKVEIDAFEKSKREKAELEEKERSEREEVEKANLERLALEAKEKLAREAAEKTAREKTEREAVQKAELERLEQESIEKSKRDAAEKISREQQAKIIAKPAPMVEKKKEQINNTTSKNNLRLFSIAGLILFVLICGAFGLNNLFYNLTVATATVPSTNDTPTFELATSTDIPFTPTPLPTETLIPTPALGIGSTMIGEKGETLVYVPAGEFTMGDGANDASIHKVYLDAFWIDQTEVTNKQYKACVDAGTCEPPSSASSYTHPNYYGNPEFDNYPVIYVNWDKANRYCKVWTGTGGSLPTEAQWEKVARGTDARTYPWGNDAPNKDLLNYNSNVGDTIVVKNYPNTASVYGTYDMAGNVWEWVNDWYSDTYYKNSTSTNNPLGPVSGQYRVLRGGSWNNSGYGVRSAGRGRYDPAFALYSIGFRCSRSQP